MKAVKKATGLIIAIVFVAMAGCSATVPDTTTGFHVGNLAPGFNLFNLTGEKVSLESFRGRPVMVNFWATD